MTPNIAKPTISTTMFEMLNTRFLKKSSGTIGSRCRSSHAMNPASSAAAAARKPSV